MLSCPATPAGDRADRYRLPPLLERDHRGRRATRREARKVADLAACEAWNIRMKGYGGPAQPSPLLGDALNAGYRYLEVRCNGCGTHNTVDLTIIRRPRETPIWQLEQRMRCKPCAEQRGYPSAAIWYGCDAARSRRKTTASLGIPATIGSQLKGGCKEPVLRQMLFRAI